MDVVPAVPWRWVPTINHGGPRVRTLGVMIHSTRGGGATLAIEYQNTVRYCAGANPSQVGPGWIVGPAEATRMSHDDDTNWCQTVDNPTFIGIEVAQPASLPPFVEFQYVACADICARLSIKYGFPARYLGRQTTPTVQVAGILGHEDSYAGYSRGKTDPGGKWDWTHFMALVAARVKELTGMTAAEQAKCGEIAGHVFDANARIGAILDEVYGQAPLPVVKAIADRVRTEQGEIHTWGVHWLKELAGLNK